MFFGAGNEFALQGVGESFSDSDIDKTARQFAVAIEVNNTIVLGAARHLPVAFSRRTFDQYTLHTSDHRAAVFFGSRSDVLLQTRQALLLHSQRRLIR